MRSGFEWAAHEGAAVDAGAEVGQLQDVLDGRLPSRTRWWADGTMFMEKGSPASA